MRSHRQRSAMCSAIFSGVTENQLSAVQINVVIAQLSHRCCPTPTVPLLLPHSLCSSQVSSHSTQSHVTVLSLKSQYTVSSHSAQSQVTVCPTHSLTTIHSLPHSVSSHSTKSALLSLRSQYTVCPTQSLVTVHSLPHSLSLKSQYTVCPTHSVSSDSTQSAPLTWSQVTVHRLPHSLGLK